MQKNVKRLSKVSLILVFLMMFSCVRDDFYEKESPNLNETTVKHYQGSQARALISRFKQGVLNSTRFSLQSNNGITYRTVNEVSISEEEVMEVKDSLGNVNYTFRVEGLSQRGSGEFYNIVINNRDGKERAFLLKYVMDPKFQTEYESGNSSIEMFRGILFIASLAGGGNPCDENIVVPVVPGNGGGGGGGGHGNGGVGVETGNGSYNNGGGLAYIQEVVYQLAMGASGCEPPAGGCEEDDVWEDCECWRQVSVNPRYYRVGIFPVLSDTPNPCDDGTIGTIGILPDKNHEKNCEKLKQMNNDTDVQESLEDLEVKQGYHDKEYSYYYQKDDNGYTATEMPNHPPFAFVSSNAFTIPFPNGENAVAVAHTHPNDGLGYLMFSPQDIEYFYSIAKHHQAGAGNLKNYSDYTFYMVTENGTYALKIENFILFRDAMTFEYDDNFEKQLEKKYQSRLPTDAQGLFEKDFLEFISKDFRIGNLGIALYKADNNFTNWNKLNLNSKGNVVSNPCP